MLDHLEHALSRQPRVRLATLPTPLERGPLLPGGARLHVKRDDLSGLGLGGNKARKLEFLCGAARAAESDTLITVGAAQSNHARMTAAAGAVLGLETHLVLGGEAPRVPSGNQLISRLVGGRLHFAGGDDWSLLEQELNTVAATLEGSGRRVYRIPMGGSTTVGAIGFVAGWIELMCQCREQGLRPSAVVHASSTGGTHAGLLAGRAVTRMTGVDAPAIIAVSVVKSAGDLVENTIALAQGCLRELGLSDVCIEREAVEVDSTQIGPGYAVPTPAGDAAIDWAARRGAWVLDRTYAGKGFAGLLDADRQGRFGDGDDVVFWHTGGTPAVFVLGGNAASQPETTPVSLIHETKRG